MSGASKAAFIPVLQKALSITLSGRQKASYWWVLKKNSAKEEDVHHTYWASTRRERERDRQIERRRNGERERRKEKRKARY